MRKLWVICLLACFGCKPDQIRDSGGPQLKAATPPYLQSRDVILITDSDSSNWWFMDDDAVKMAPLNTTGAYLFQITKPNGGSDTIRDRDTVQVFALDSSYRKFITSDTMVDQDHVVPVPDNGKDAEKNALLVIYKTAPKEGDDPNAIRYGDGFKIRGTRGTAFFTYPTDAHDLRLRTRQEASKASEFKAFHNPGEAELASPFFAVDDPHYCSEKPDCRISSGTQARKGFEFCSLMILVNPDSNGHTCSLKWDAKDPTLLRIINHPGDSCDLRFSYIRTPHTDAEWKQHHCTGRIPY